MAPKVMTKFAFTPITKHPLGTIFSLLSQSYVPIWNDKLEQTIPGFYTAQLPSLFPLYITSAIR